MVPILEKDFLGPDSGIGNKTKDWALVQNAALAGVVKVELGLFM